MRGSSTEVRKAKLVAAFFGDGPSTVAIGLSPTFKTTVGQFRSAPN
jgi:hypothetical protein